MPDRDIRLIAENMDFGDEQGLEAGPVAAGEVDDLDGPGELPDGDGVEDQSNKTMTLTYDALVKLLELAKEGEGEIIEGGCGMESTKKGEAIKEDHGGLDGIGGDDEEVDTMDVDDEGDETGEGAPMDLGDGAIEDTEGGFEVDEHVMGLVDAVCDVCATAEGGVCTVADVESIANGDEEEGEFPGDEGGEIGEVGDEGDEGEGGLDLGGDEGGEEVVDDEGDDEYDAMEEAVMQSVNEITPESTQTRQEEEVVEENIALQSTTPVFSVEVPNKYKIQYDAYLAEDGGFMIARDNNPYIYLNENGARQIGGGQKALTKPSPALDYFFGKWAEADSIPESLTESVQTIRSKSVNYENRPIFEAAQEPSLIDSVATYLTENSFDDIEVKAAKTDNGLEVVGATSEQMQEMANKISETLNEALSEGYDTKKIGSMSKYRRCFPVEGGGKYFFVFK